MNAGHGEDLGDLTNYSAINLRVNFDRIAVLSFWHRQDWTIPSASGRFFSLSVNSVCSVRKKMKSLTEDTEHTEDTVATPSTPATLSPGSNTENRYHSFGVL